MISNNKKARAMRGFTLTEAAIVLGIVGLILGAIWVAAASVYNNLRVSRTSEQILQIAQNVRSIYSTQNIISANTTALEIARAGGIPKDMMDDPNNPTTIKDVWGGDITINRTTGPAPGVLGDSFYITFTRVPQQACTDIMVRNTGSGRDSGLVGVDNGPIATTAFPLTIGNAIAKCGVTTVAGNSVTFTFKLKG